MDPKGRDEMLELVHDLGHNKGVNLILSSHLLPDARVRVRSRDRHRQGAECRRSDRVTQAPRGQVFELRVKPPPGGLEAFLTN